MSVLTAATAGAPCVWGRERVIVVGGGGGGKRLRELRHCPEDLCCGEAVALD